MDLYSVLDIPNDSSLSDIKKAYYKKALLYHPDRCNNVDTTQEFQKVALAYEVLADDNRRKIYDATGLIDNKGEAMVWKDYMEAMFPKVTLSILDEFKEKYVGSAEEYEDILAAYVASNGSMRGIIDTIFWGDADQSNRYFLIIERAISRKIVPKLKKFKPLSVKAVENIRKRENSEKGEAEELYENMRKKDPRISDLEGYIVSRQKENLAGIISKLESKYGKSKK